MADRDRARSGWADGLLDHLRDGLRGYLDVLGDEPEAPGADASSDRLDPPPAAEPYQPRRDNAVHLREAINNPPGQVIDERKPHQPSKGHPMASIEEVKAGINQSNDTASNSLGALQQAASHVEQAQQELMGAVEGSGQNDQQEAQALYAKALESINEAQQGVQRATQSAEGVAARL